MSDFKDDPKLEKIFLTILDNIRAQYEKTGKINGSKYDRWEHAKPKAWQVANAIMRKRHPEYFKRTKSSYMSRENKDILAALDDYHRKTRLYNSFNHPDYKHMHGFGYDPDK